MGLSLEAGDFASWLAPLASLHSYQHKINECFKSNHGDFQTPLYQPTLTFYSKCISFEISQKKLSHHSPSPFGFQNHVFMQLCKFKSEEGANQLASHCNEY